MSWVWYEEDIVHKYSIILVGWTFPELANPSTLSTSLPALQELHDALKNGACRFEKLTPEKLADRKKNWLADVNAGRRERKHRAERSDKGVKRSRADVDNEDDEEDDEGAEEDDERSEEGTGART
ncbi:hypothetical protein B0H14DRAFT_57681 [Mycena olivaceomarginata]|nr:hypothetical protein B0H14DRAFT_57681 [Mycena olivaceomarginata]